VLRPILTGGRHPVRWTQWIRAIAVVLGATALLLAGLPGLQDHADAAPRLNRCMDKYGTSPTPPPRYTLPGYRPAGGGQWATPNAEQRLYPFDLPSDGFDGLLDPSVVPLPKGPDPKKYTWGTIENAAATWKQKQAGASPYKGTFNEWLNNIYARNVGNNRRGSAYEREFVKYFGIGGVDWLCQTSLKQLDPDLYNELKAELGSDFPKSDRILDIVNPKTRTIYETKSGNSYDEAQFPVDRALVKRGWKVVYVNGEAPDPETLAKFDEAGIEHYLHAATPDPQFEETPYMTKSPTVMTPDPAQPSVGSGSGMVNRSAPTPEDMRRQIARARGLVEDPAQDIRGPGGVDFSTLDLSYVGQTSGGSLRYAFSAKNTDQDTEPGYGGKEKAQLISDAFFTWLALTPDHFWVNLNPDDPNTVMKAPFDRTDAGRVLLQADLNMKRDFGRTEDPKTDAGKAFWYGISRIDGAPCMNSTRNWIVPKQARVRVQDDGVYILDSPLEIKTVAQNYSTPGPGGGKVCDLTKAQIDHNMSVYRSTILPIVEKKVNEDPEYADLRRVYKARIGAEYVRQTVAKDPKAFGGAFDRIINSDDVTKWPLRGANSHWDKTTVWREMRKSYTEGDFSYQLPVGGKVYIYTVGGVDFSKQPQQKITQASFHAQKPNLDDVTRHVKSQALSYKSAGVTFMGGDNSGRAGGGGGAGGGSGHTPPAANQPSGNGGGGDLAATGADVLGVAGAAAAFVVVGGALVWSRRRRGAAGG
jgi:hypothetical protein